jgi:hypothetical protein
VTHSAVFKIIHIKILVNFSQKVLVLSHIVAHQIIVFCRALLITDHNFTRALRIHWLDLSRAACIQLEILTLFIKMIDFLKRKIIDK